MAACSARLLVQARPVVLLDLFHTLVAVEFSPAREGPGTPEVLGVDRGAWHEQLMERSRERLTGELRDPVEIIRRMAHAIDPGIPLARIREACEGRAGRFAQALLHPLEATCLALSGLRAAGKRLGLVSNADVTEVSAWPRSPMAPYFDVAVFSCDVGYAKPEAGIYQVAMERLGVGPSECVFVGDGSCHELEGARALGLSTVMMCGFVRAIWPDKVAGRQVHADACIEALTELVP